MPYRNKYNAKLYKARCAICGFETIRTLSHIKKTRECKHVDATGRYIDNKTHPKEDMRLYRILSKIKQRCYNKNNKNYNRYGGRGIYVCDQWLNDNSSFVEWAYENGYSKELTIDRIDSGGPYSPDNCRWITNKDNARYKSTTNLYTVNDLTMTGKQWSLYLGLGVNRINTYAREYGKEETCKFIAWYLEHPEIKEKVKSHTSYYSLYKGAIS